MDGIHLTRTGRTAPPRPRPRRRARALLAVSLAAAASCGAVAPSSAFAGTASGTASASASGTVHGPSTRGVIVWTERTDAGDHLMIARADGSHARSLTPVIPDEGDIDAQVSPDGRWILYEH